MDKFVVGKFSTHITPKDGFAIVECEDPREKRVLEFIVPILYPEKPTRITMTLSNTIFGAFFGVRKVSWGLVMQELVGKLVSRLEKWKPSPISPYLFHLYSNFECLREGEASMLDTTRAMLEFVIAPEVQLDTKDEDSDRELLNSEEQRRFQAVSSGLKKKQTYKAIDGKAPIRLPNWKEVAMISFDFEDNPFRRIGEEID